MEKEIKHFIYIDSEGIDSLYYQLPDITTLVKTITTKYTGGKLSSNLGIGLLKSLSAKVGSDIEAKHQIQEERRKEVTVENKIDAILKNLNDGKIERLFDVLNNCNYEGLVACKSLFRFIRAYDEDVNRQKFNRILIGIRLNIRIFLLFLQVIHGYHFILMILMFFNNL